MLHEAALPEHVIQIREWHELRAYKQTPHKTDGRRRIKKRKPNGREGDCMRSRKRTKKKKERERINIGEEKEENEENEENKKSEKE